MSWKWDDVNNNDNDYDYNYSTSRGRVIEADDIKAVSKNKVSKDGGDITGAMNFNTTGGRLVIPVGLNKYA